MDHINNEIKKTNKAGTRQTHQDTDGGSQEEPFGNMDEESEFF